MRHIVRSGALVVLESDALRVTFEPRLGGKIRSFYSRRIDCEYFYQDHRTSLQGSGYSAHDISGLDECFPTVMACDYPEGRWQGVPLGDHGLLWNLPWQTEIQGQKLRVRVAPPELPVRMTRTAELVEPHVLQLEYSIHNGGDEPLQYLYAAHLLLHADPTTSLVYPADMDRVYVAVALDNPELQEGGWTRWPPSPAARLQPPWLPERNTLVKLFSPRLNRGTAGITHGDQAEQLQIEFDTERLPYLAILLLLGYGPTGQDGRSMLVGLEPTSGIGDDLPMCRRTGTSQAIAPGATLEFWLRFSLWSPSPRVVMMNEDSTQHRP